MNNARRKSAAPAQSAPFRAPNRRCTRDLLSRILSCVVGHERRGQFCFRSMGSASSSRCIAASCWLQTRTVFVSGRCRVDPPRVGYPSVLGSGALLVGGRRRLLSGRPVSTGFRRAELRSCVADLQQTPLRVELDASFDEFVASGSPRLLRSAYLLTGDRGHSEDLLQVALVRVARRWDVARDAPHAYAHRVLVNLLHDRRRHLSRRVKEQPLGGHDDRHRPVADGTEGLVDRIAIIDALRGLPLRQREVVVLRFFADLSVSETAAAIGSSEGTVKTDTSRALLALRGVLTEDAIQSTMRRARRRAD